MHARCQVRLHTKIKRSHARGAEVRGVRLSICITSLRLTCLPRCCHCPGPPSASRRPRARRSPAVASATACRFRSSPRRSTAAHRPPRPICSSAACSASRLACRRCLSPRALAVHAAPCSLICVLVARDWPQMAWANSHPPISPAASGVGVLR